MGSIGEDEVYMRRCILLAKNGMGTCSPNPMVGALLVYDGRIIGEGWHRKAGEPHAEPNAINAVKNEDLLAKSTLYVSLEPCSHYGKTPPCVELILRKHIPRVVIGTLDPFPLVAGRGVKRLRDAGVDVTVGVEEYLCNRLNRNFFDFLRFKRPRVILKWAQSRDGFMDISRTFDDGLKPLTISTSFTRMLTHKLRSECDAIMVGTQTAQLDNPSLNVRYWTGKSPLRIVFDRNNILSEDINLFDGSFETLVYTEGQSVRKSNTYWKQLDFSNDPLASVMDDLYQRKIQVLLVEGGAKLHESFLQRELWDEIHIEVSGIQVGTGVQAPALNSLLLNSAELTCYGDGDNIRKVWTIIRS
jgi:diaminohydroxyphosphoribosylaminopyrimidine deaminase / 5-amino-6-(5-phosphoribosylamino)uracil reductase